MHQTLRWHRVGVGENLAALRDGLARKAAALSGGREQALTSRWFSSVEEILRQIGSVRLVVIPAVERDLGFSHRKRRDLPPLPLPALHEKPLLRDQRPFQGRRMHPLSDRPRRDGPPP